MMIELFFHGAVLGVIQGLTEFFPVSSSGHLILMPALFRWRDQGIIFDVVVHGGTLVAVIAAFWGDLRRIVTNACIKRQKAAQRFAVRILVAAVPGLLVGGLFGEVIEQSLRGPATVAISLAVWGIVLWIADRWSATHTRTLTTPQEITWAQALIVGGMQAIALVPGTSRSGITMTGGLFAGMDRKTAVNVSFLISIPTIAAAFAYGLIRMGRQGLAPGEAGMLFAGFAAAALTGFGAIRALQWLVERHTFAPFVWYRLALAALIALSVL